MSIGSDSRQMESLRRARGRRCRRVSRDKTLQQGAVLLGDLRGLGGGPPSCVHVAGLEEVGASGRLVPSLGEEAPTELVGEGLFAHEPLRPGGGDRPLVEIDAFAHVALDACDLRIDEQHPMGVVRRREGVPNPKLLDLGIDR